MSKDVHSLVLVAEENLTPFVSLNPQEVAEWESEPRDLVQNIRAARGFREQGVTDLFSENKTD